MRLIHKMMLIMPTALIFLELFCVYFFVKTEFYKKNFYLIDRIDTLLVFLCASHFVFFHFLYTYISKTSLSCIYFLIILNFLYIYISNELYFFLYNSIVLIFTTSALWKKIS